MAAPDTLKSLGSYRIVRVLGEGGMGRVYLAEDAKLRRNIALKVMKPEFASNDVARRRFLREAQAAAAVKHDHIVTIHQVGEDRNIPFLAMELLAGESLEERLRSEEPLSIAEVLRIGRQTAEGLSAAHDHGLIHRDVKPANIFLERSDRGPFVANRTAATVIAAAAPRRFRVKLLDFGLARPADAEELTQAGAIVGTAGYMAPEQCDGRVVEPRSDLFSLGCVLYRLTTGRPAFKGKDILSTLMLTATEDPPAPTTIRPKVPAALSDLIMELLAKDPDDRPGSAAEVVAQLEAIEQGETPARKRRRRSRSSRSPVLLAIAGLSALVLGAVVLMAVFLFRTASVAEQQVAEREPPKPVAAPNAAPKIEPVNAPLPKVEPPKAGPPKVVDSPAHDREVAAWVMSKGGNVMIEAEPNGKPFDTKRLVTLKFTDPKKTAVSYRVNNSFDLPAEGYRLVEIVFPLAKNLTDEDMARITDLGELRKLNIMNTDITDAGLERIDRLPKIKIVTVQGPGVTAEGIGRLRMRCGAVIAPAYGVAVTDPGGVNRAAADWVFAQGGTVDISLDDGLKKINVYARNKLPKDPFVVRSIYILNNKGDMTDEGLKVIAPLRSLQRLSLGSPALTDKCMETIGGIEDLRDLLFSDSRITDKGCVHLRKLKNLRTLYFGNALVTDAALENLEGLPEFNGLFARPIPKGGPGPKITDRGMTHLRKAANLKDLDLGGTEITAAGLAELAGLKQLTSLQLEEASISDDDLKTIAALPAVTYLRISKTRVTDKGMPILAGMAKLNSLDLGGTAITDAGLDAFSPRSDSGNLRVQNTRVTEEGAARFRAAHPTWTVTR